MYGKVHRGVYTSEPILLFPVSSFEVGCLACSLSVWSQRSGQKENYFKIRSSSGPYDFYPQAVLKSPFDVDWATEEYNGKVCAALLSLWHFVFKTLRCFAFFFPFFCAILLWHSGVYRTSVGLPNALWDCGSLAYGLWMCHPKFLRRFLLLWNDFLPEPFWLVKFKWTKFYPAARKKKKKTVNLCFIETTRCFNEQEDPLEINLHHYLFSLHK